MSHCRDFEEAWWEAAEGRPVSPEAEAHLRGCESCRAAVRRLSAASRGFEALRAVEAPDPSVAVWGRVARPKRRPAFALAWAAAAAACIVAGTFALRHGPAPPPLPLVSPVQRIAKASPAAPQVKPAAPLRLGTPVAESAQPVKANVESSKHAMSGTGHLASVHPKRQVGERREAPQPAPTQVVEAPAAGGVTVAEAEASTPCSQAAALAYRAIGRALVARLFSSNGEAG